MKYAVKVENQEEQDFVSMKLHGETYNSRWNYVTNDKRIIDIYKTVINNGYEIISFDEFKLRYELKIGDTFEHNGFVCEVKEKIEEKKWYRVIVKEEDKVLFEKMTINDSERFNELEYLEITKITDKEFIKQLEENAR